MYASFDTALRYLDAHSKGIIYLAPITNHADEGFGLVIDGEVVMHVNHETAERLTVIRELSICSLG